MSKHKIEQILVRTGESAPHAGRYEVALHSCRRVVEFDAGDTIPACPVCKLEIHWVFPPDEDFLAE